MQDRYLCWTSYFFLGPAVPPIFLILESPQFDRFSHSKSIFITTESHHAGETFMLALLLFSLAPPWPPSFFILESPLFITKLLEKQFKDSP